MFPCSAEIVLRVRMNRSHIHHGLLLFMNFFTLLGYIIPPMFALILDSNYYHILVIFLLSTCIMSKKRKLSVYICVTHNSN